MNTFHVLIVENDQHRCEFIRSKLAKEPLIQAVFAYSAEDAIAAIARQGFQLALVDIALRKEVENEGTRILSVLQECRPSCRRIAYTKDPAYAATKLLRARDPLAHGFLGKEGGASSDDFYFIREQAHRWLESPVTVAGLEPIAQDLASKLTPQPDPEALANELDYLVSRIFGQGSDSPTSIKSIALAPLTGGRSRSVVTMGLPRDGQGREGIRTVIKFSSRKAAVDERNAYSQFVRFMLPLSQRVELLGYFEADTIGATCYSFVGEQNSPVKELSTLICQQEEEVFTHLDTVLGALCRTWYRNLSPNEDQIQYVADKFFVDGRDIREKITGFAQKIAPQIKGTLTANGLRVGKETLQFPTEEDGALGRLRSTSFCVIHGDLHAGNVLVQPATNQVVLIDYQYTGPGPAYLDFAALDASPRVLPRNNDKVTATSIAEQMDLEQRIWQAIWSPNASEPADLPYWARVCVAVGEHLREQFDGISPVDYAGTCLLWAFRVFKVAHLGDAPKMRLLVWISHLLTVLRKSEA